MCALENNCDDVIRLLKASKEICGQLIQEISKNQSSEDGTEQLLRFVLSEYHKRFFKCMLSLEILMKGAPSFRHIESSVGLLIRPCLHDYTMIAYFSSIVKKGAANQKTIQYNLELKKALEDYLSDHVFRVAKHLEEAKEKKILDKEEFNRGVHYLVQSWPFAFNNDSIDFEFPHKSVKNKFIGLKKIATRIEQSKLIGGHFHAFYNHDYYSKYEHFGIMTSPLDQRSDNDKLVIMISSLADILHGMKASLVYFNFLENQNAYSEGFGAIYNEFVRMHKIADSRLSLDNE